MHITNPYFQLMRLHQPVGIWLLLWPCYFSLALNSDGIPSPYILALFALGAVVMRGAGCIINDICDREFDKQVERTKNRPLANGALTVRQALCLLAFLMLLAFVIALSLGIPAILWSAAALPLVALYPLMKRITWWPQLFLGLTFNWGVLVAAVAMTGTINLPTLLLYIGCIFWTLGYDTIYAHQDKVDDARIGVKSTALRLGRTSKIFVTICYSLFGLCLLVASLLQPAYSLLASCLLALSYGLMLSNLLQLDIDNSDACRRSFVSQSRIAAVIFAALLLA
jgi:4-hydroxybenzoate polyprenyltransferase